MFQKHMKANKSYIIEYKAYNPIGVCISDQPIKVKNCMSDIHAKVKLEKYLKKKYKYFYNLEIISCDEVNDEFIGDEGILNKLKDILGV